MQAIVAGIGFFLVALIPETHNPTIIRKRALKSSDPAARDSIPPALPLSKRLRVAFTLPFRLFCTEPIVFAVCCYMALVYGLVRLSLVAFLIKLTGACSSMASSLGFLMPSRASGVSLAKTWRWFTSPSSLVVSPAAWCALLCLTCFHANEDAQILYYPGSRSMVKLIEQRTKEGKAITPEDRLTGARLIAPTVPIGLCVRFFLIPESA